MSVDRSKSNFPSCWFKNAPARSDFTADGDIEPGREGPRRTNFERGLLGKTSLLFSWSRIDFADDVIQVCVCRRHSPRLNSGATVLLLRKFPIASAAQRWTRESESLRPPWRDVRCSAGFEIPVSVL